MLDGREDFRDFMLVHGIPEAEILTMTDEEFQMTLNALLDENSPRISHNQNYANRQTRQTRQTNQRYRGTTLADGFGNGNFDEEEAVRMAIENSLDDMLVAPHLRQPPSPQNEVGFHSRPSSNAHNNMNRNYNYNYRNEPTNYPPRPNPKPTPLPSSKTPRSNEASKYPSKDRSPSCSHPRRPPPPQQSQYTSQAKKKDTPHTGTTSKPQPKPRPTTTSTASTSINHNLVVTNSKQKISSNAPISGTTVKKTPRAPQGSKPSNPQSGTRPSTKPASRKTTTTPSTATRPSNAPATKAGPNRNIPSHPSSRSSTRATGETIVHSNRPSANQTPRSRPAPKDNNTNHSTSKRVSTNDIDNTNNYPHKPKSNIKPTFSDEAIADPTPNILHPKHFINDDDSLLDDPLINYQPHTKTKTSTNYNRPQPKQEPPPQPKPKPQPQPQPKPKPQEKPPEVQFSESQILRNIQDMEFIMATQEAERKEREEAEKKAQEERKLQEEKAKKESKLDEANRLFRSIPPEPSNGEKAITIAAQIPNSKRVMRKFSPNTKGIHVYAWISGQTLEFSDDEKLFVDSFELMQAGGQVQTLEKNKTLEEQGISGKVFFQVSVL